MQPSPQPAASGSSDLTAAALALDQAATPAPAPIAPAPAAPVVDWTAEARGIWTLAAGALAIRFPSVGRVYTPEAIDKLAVAWAPVLQAHNLHLGRFTIYFVAAGVTVPLVVDGARAIRDELAAEKAAAAAAEKQPAAPA